MSGSHVPLDRLTEWALAGTSNGDHDQRASDHLAGCDRCAAALSQLRSDLATIRQLAWDEADAIFDDGRLDAQRGRILDRLAHLGQAARVLCFPGRNRTGAMPVSSASRRWISIAAASGLIIGLLAGQSIHFVPWDARLHRTGRNTAAQVPPRVAVPLQAVASAPALSDDDLLDAVNAAVQLRHVASLRALDALTPVAGELTEIR